MADRDSAYRFLASLFPEVPDDAAILLWTLRGRRSVWCTSTEEAADKAVEIGDDVYVGACLGPRSIMADPRAGKLRAKADQVLYITSLWADVDIADPVHQKQDLPKTIEAAGHLTGMMPHKTSGRVFTGHGLQPWWLFKEPLNLHDPCDLELAARLMKGWNELLRRKAEVMGWVVDSVFDLARVMRVPGTRNCKGKDPVDCTILEWDDAIRYSPEDFEPYLPVEQIDAPAPRSSGGNGVKSSRERAIEATAPEVGEFQIDPAAEMPKKHEVAERNDGTFKDTINKMRRDLRDQSFSAYDQSLADQAVAIGWSDQEIVDLLIAFRRKHNGPAKLRRDYFVMTITKARRAISQVEAEESIEELAALTRTKGVDEMSEAEATAVREEALKSLSIMFEFEILGIERTKSQPPIYSIRTRRGLYVIGGSSKISSPGAFKNAIIDAMKIVPGKRKKGTWDDVLRLMLQACVEVDVGPEATSEGAATMWLQGYLSDSPPVDIDENPNSPMREFYPVLKDIGGTKYLCVETRDLRQWIKTAHGYGDRVEQVNLGMCLRSIGAVSKSVRVRQGSNPRRCWVLVPDEAFMPDPDHARRRLALVAAQAAGGDPRMPGANEPAN